MGATDNGILKKESDHNPIRASLAQILAVSVKNVLLISFGMTLGFPTILIPGLSGSNSNESFSLSENAISWIGSINLICVPVGCMVSGGVTQLIGRKRAMQLVNIPFVLAWMTFRFSNAVWQIYVALCITGLTGGLLEAPVLTYVAEITQPNLRGILSSTSTMSVIAGILIQFLLGTFLSWRTVALISCVFPAIAFVLLFFIPESPHWLISKNRLLDARKSIAWLRGWKKVDDIEPEFKELLRYIGKSTEKDLEAGVKNLKITNSRSKLETLQLLFKKNFIWPYSIVGFTFILGHFSGMTTLQTFAVQIFSSLQAPIDKYYCTVILGVVELIGCVICVFMVHVLGKRKLNFISMIGCGICFAIVAAYAYSIDVKYIINNNNGTNITETTRSNNKSYSWVPLTFLVASALVSHAGIRVLPWILTGELYSNETRAAASGLSGAIGYIFGFLANKTFLSMVSSFTLWGTFGFNSAVSFIGCIVLYFVLPETEGKTLHEITEHFNGGEKLDNDVKKKKKKNRLRNATATGNINPNFNFTEAQKHVDSRL